MTEDERKEKDRIRSKAYYYGENRDSILERQRNYTREYRKKNKDNPEYIERIRNYDRSRYSKNKERRSITCRKRRINNRAKALFDKAKERAKSRGIEFNITVEDIIIPNYCPVFGTQFFEPDGKLLGAQPNSMSLDRKDPSKGYTKENIWVISHRANTIKNDATIDELRLIVMALDNIK